MHQIHPKIPLKHTQTIHSVCSVWDKGYRYGFNSMEKDNEINVNGGSYDFGARIYDSRLGRWLSLDPLIAKYPNVSAYVFSVNNPSIFIDPNGLKVVAMSPEAQEILRLTLTPEEAKFIEFDEIGILNTQKLADGLTEIKEPGKNFSSLIYIANHEKTVEISLQINACVKNSNGQEVESPMVGLVPVLDDDGKETGEFTTEAGTVGLTLVPIAWSNYTNFDKNIMEKVSPDKRKFSTNDNFQVVVSKNVHSLNTKRSVKTLAHELYGHANFLLKGDEVKGGLHGPVRSPNNVNANEDNFNGELESQIKQSVNEAENNYDKHKT